MFFVLLMEWLNITSLNIFFFFFFNFPLQEKCPVSMAHLSLSKLRHSPRSLTPRHLLGTPPGRAPREPRVPAILSSTITAVNYRIEQRPSADVTTAPGPGSRPGLLTPAPGSGSRSPAVNRDPGRRRESTAGHERVWDGFGALRAASGWTGPGYIHKGRVGTRRDGTG